MNMVYFFMKKILFIFKWFLLDLFHNFSQTLKKPSSLMNRACIKYDELRLLGHYLTSRFSKSLIL